jgi:mono/diheme cytochrome c family protein
VGKSSRRKPVLLVASILLTLNAPITAPATHIPSGSGASEARNIYLNHCAACHGESGKGDGPQASAFKTRVHSFADCDWMSMRSDATLFLIIQQGSGAVGLPPAMPGFSGKLDDLQTIDLIRFIRNICQSQ